MAVIPARGGSKGIPGKNIAMLAGQPLIVHTIEAAKNCTAVDRVVVSTDSAEIGTVAQKAGAEVPFLRPAELAQDQTPSLPVIQHAVQWLEENEGYCPDIIVLLQPTSPLRTGVHIDEAVALLCESDADSVVSVVRVPHNYSPTSVMTMADGVLSPYEPMDEQKNVRQMKPVFYARNGAAIYAFTRTCLLEKGSLYGDRMLGYEMDRQSSVDIDEPFDLEMCEWLLKRSECSS